jgi:ferredoxin hydrogenase large subunit
MRRITSEIDKIRRQVLTDVARLAFEGKLLREIEELPYRLFDNGIKNYRCCEYKERAVLRERIRLALGEDPAGDREPLVYAATQALKRKKIEGPMLQVIDIACDECPIDSILVTDACRHCVAHNCENACRRDAIRVINGKAVIEKDKCIECGLCVGACQYGAILKIQRPCERACQVEAIRSREDRHASIDPQLCVGCGQCTISCPFGAISYKSEILPVILNIIDNRKTIALVAPSAPGQFGRNLSMGHLFAGLAQLGFTRTQELGFAADLVAEQEAAELADEWLTNSCCPAYKELVVKHHPSLASHVSTMPSPMALAAKLVRESEPDAFIVFIGPCLAKKAEARQLVDAVLTFEELACMFVAKKINLSTLTPQKLPQRPSAFGRGFAASGGVACAVGNQKEVKVEKADGLSECQKALTLAQKLGLDADFLEGMACTGGCVGGPGTLVDSAVSKRALAQDLKESEEIKKTG